MTMPHGLPESNGAQRAVDMKRSGRPWRLVTLLIVFASALTIAILRFSLNGIPVILGVLLAIVAFAVVAIVVVARMAWARRANDRRLIGVARQVPGAYVFVSVRSPELMQFAASIRAPGALSSLPVVSADGSGLTLWAGAGATATPYAFIDWRSVRSIAPAWIGVAGYNPSLGFSLRLVPNGGLPAQVPLIPAGTGWRSAAPARPERVDEVVDRLRALQNEPGR